MYILCCERIQAPCMMSYCACPQSCRVARYCDVCNSTGGGEEGADQAKGGEDGECNMYVSCNVFFFCLTSMHDHAKSCTMCGCAWATYASYNVMFLETLWICTNMQSHATCVQQTYDLDIFGALLQHVYMLCLSCMQVAPASMPVKQEVPAAAGSSTASSSNSSSTTSSGSTITAGGRHNILCMSCQQF